MNSHCRLLGIGFSFILGGLFCPYKVNAASGTEGAAFLEIPIGAGPAALGSAYTALATDAYGTVYNPAGLGFVTSPGLAAQHLSYLESINDEFLSYVHPVGEGKTIGAAAQYLGSGDISGTDQQGNANGTYSSHYGAYSIAYGQKFTDKLSLGITGKWLNAKLADVGANALAVDLGSLYQVNDNFTLALTGTNLGSKLTFSNQADTLPREVHLAAAYQTKKHWTAAVEAVHNQSGLNSGRFGVEWSPLDVVKLRAGYKTDTTKDLSALAGVTVGLGLKAWGQEFAYAWVPYGDLGNTQYFSLLLHFGVEKEERKNLIQYRDIHAHQMVVGPHKQKRTKTDEPEDDQMIQLLSHDENAARTAQTPPSSYTTEQ